MDGTASLSEQTVLFKSAERFLSDLDAGTMGRIIASAADVALVIDDGIIQDVALGNRDLTREGYDRTWPGKLWSDTVTIESRPKIEDLLRGDPASTIPWRQVNHPSAAGSDVPIKYTAVRTGGEVDRIVALGRDMRSLSRLQQRLVEAHQELERDYTRLREAESRYRLLFRSVSQPVVVLDPTTLEIAEANPASAAVLGRPVSSLVGASLEEAFPPESRRSVQQLVSEAMSLGSADASEVAMKEGGSCQIKASAFRFEESTRVIVQLTVGATGAATPEAGSHGRLMSVLEELPDGLIVVGSDLRILAANRAFVEMAHLVSPAQIVGQRLSDFLGRSATELNVLTSNLRSHGAVRNFTTVFRDRFGNEEEVEVSAVTTSAETAATYGLSVRNVARTFRVDRQAGEGLPSSPDQLTRLVGRVPLREIVRQTTDFIEKLCIEAALEVTGDNRASAAEMLGLSRQGLYSKLKRFELDH